MGLRKSRNAPRQSDIEPPSPLEVVEATRIQLEQAKRARDLAIISARNQRTPLRQIAAAADLSVARIKQIDGDNYRPHVEIRPPITEHDLYLEGFTLDRGDRVLAIEEVAPFLHRWDSEKHCLDESPTRKTGHRFDISHKIYDVDPGSTWTLVYIANTKEIIAYGRKDTGEKAEMWDGATTGPCLLLGHLPTWTVTEKALDRPISNAVTYRPGGLAWAYGRIQATNRIIKALTDPSADLFDLPPARVWKYLDDLPESEKP